VRNEEHLVIEHAPASFAVPPHKLRSFPVTEELIAFSVRQRQFQERYERTLCAQSVIGLRLHYSGWREDRHSSRDEHHLRLWPPLSKELCIQRYKRNV